MIVEFNSERFIIAFNRIEKSLEKISGLSSYMPYSRLSDKTKGTNEIVHRRMDVEYAIAEPHDNIVKLIEYIEREFSKPVIVGDLFQWKVHTLQASDTLETGLKLIHDKRFNKIPIYENRKFVGLITSTGIAHRLADKGADEIISREIPTFLDIH